MFFEVLLIGLVLSADSFSAAIAMGMRPFTSKDAIKFAIASAAAEALVAWFGAFAGENIVSSFKSYDHWIAFFLLMGVALHMVFEGFRDFRSKKIKEEQLEFHGFAKILIVSFATSLDAFGVGIGLGVAGEPILPYIISIGIWAFAATIMGLNLAKKLSRKFGPVVTLFGAAVLMIIAFQMLQI
ncbi:MAG: manganese efflux pump [Pseudomonadota bacterium]